MWVRGSMPCSCWASMQGCCGRGHHARAPDLSEEPVGDARLCLAASPGPSELKAPYRSSPSSVALLPHALGHLSTIDTCRRVRNCRAHQSGSFGLWCIGFPPYTTVQLSSEIRCFTGRWPWCGVGRRGGGTLRERRSRTGPALAGDILATPAGSDHPGVGPLRSPVVASGRGPRPTRAWGGEAFPWGANRDGRPAGDGVGDRTPWHERPSGAEPSDGVGPSRQAATVGRAQHRAGASRSDGRAWSRRDRGTPCWTHAHGEGRRSRAPPLCCGLCARGSLGGPGG
jgi:hypothetical protein